MTVRPELSFAEHEELLAKLHARFTVNMGRHPNLQWNNIQAKLKTQPEKLWSLNQMECTGGEPDVIDYDPDKDEYVFYDCSAESPLSRRSACYDRESLDVRKEPKPENTVMDMAAEMGIEVLTEADYRHLQEHGSYDTKTSSWIKTPSKIRGLGGALFCDRRYDTVFVYHNGAGSYYSSRGFRGLLRI